MIYKVKQRIYKELDLKFRLMFLYLPKKLIKHKNKRLKQMKLMKKELLKSLILLHLLLLHKRKQIIEITINSFILFEIS